MRPAARFSGLPVSSGTAAGVLRIAGDATDYARAASATPEEVAAAFTAVAADRSALAARLREAGRGDEADIVLIGTLIAGDPAFAAAAVAAVRAGTDAVRAVRAAAEQNAVAMERLDNPALAERAGDIRQIGSAVLDHLASNAGRDGSDGSDGSDERGLGGVAGPGGGGDAGSAGDTADFILVGREVSAADLIELAETGLVGAVSVAGGASSHAAIIARGLGLPMIAGASPDVLSLPPGQAAVLDADSGELIIGGPAAHPTAQLVSLERTQLRNRVPEGAGAAGAEGAEMAAGTVGTVGTAGDDPRAGGAVRTADGREVTVLCNVASAMETRRGLAAGAAGVGLLRTEIPYTSAAGWPTPAQHRAQLGPILALLKDRTATVRLLDFSGDKVPPFISAEPGAGLAALLGHPSALADQLRAVLGTGTGARLALLIPMVSSLSEVSRVHDVLARTAASLGAAMPPLGIMVELESTAANAAAFAPAVDFFSIGTNDLTGDVLGLGRRDQAAGPALAAHPRVLTLVRRVAEAGRDAGITVSVCGDAAADPRVLPLLIGAGVRAVSVPAARVAPVRSLIAELSATDCAELARRALLTSSAEQVWDLVAAR